jgi:hypothetical protein
MILVYEIKIQSLTIKNSNPKTSSNGYELDVELKLEKFDIEENLKCSNNINNYLNRELNRNHSESCRISVDELDESYDVDISKSYTYISIGVKKDKFLEIYGMLTSQDKKINYLYLDFDEKEFKEKNNIIDDFSYYLKDGEKFQLIKKFI